MPKDTNRKSKPEIGGPFVFSASTVNPEAVGVPSVFDNPAGEAWKTLPPSDDGSHGFTLTAEAVTEEGFLSGQLVPLIGDGTRMVFVGTYPLKCFPSLRHFAEFCCDFGAEVYDWYRNGKVTSVDGLFPWVRDNPTPFFESVSAGSIHEFLQSQGVHVPEGKISDFKAIEYGVLESGEAFRVAARCDDCWLDLFASPT